MKGLKTILGVLATASLLFSVSAFAQENNNRDENGNVVRGPYETNAALDNTFIGIGAGWNAGIWDFSMKNSWFQLKPDVQILKFNLQGQGGLAADLYAGKWFTPAIGARIGYKGITNTIGKVNFSNINFHYAHADAMWNILNSISGYKETRLYEPIPYATMGVLIYKKDMEYAAGVGLLNNFRITDRLDVNLDLTVLCAHQRQFSNKGGRFFWPLSATVGVAYNFGKTNFDRHSSITPTVIPVPFTVEQYNALEAKVKALEKENADLKNKVAALESELAPFKNLVDGQEYLYKGGKFTAVEAATVATPASVYFDLGSAKISEREQAHLEYFAKNAVNGDTKLVITGSADKQTGTAKVNQALSEKRANAVKDILVKKYGANPANIEVVAEGDKNNVFDTPAKNRVVTIKVK